ncbi:MAG TPA: peptide-methionine (R)-S-oxide reductase, partial [Planctomycetia bacterium]|nr:peptide-methionine (R)-S-oxide reductase [Planctomycetia bacterium]
MPSSSGFDLTPPTPEEFERLASTLGAEERRVLLQQGTEPAFCGGLLANKEPGEYRCRLCDLPLFRSSAKFESGTGWPSFY